MLGTEQKIILAGYGGQGIVLAGNLLARACIIVNKYVTGMVAYGAEMRGGTAYATVVISDEEIASPVVETPNAAIILNQQSLDCFEKVLAPNAVAVINTSIIKREPVRTDIKFATVEATCIADELGNGRVANIVALGKFVAVTRCVSADSVLEAIDDLFSEKQKSMAQINKQAFLRGAQL